MQRIFAFRPKYALAALALFTIEVLIAVFVHDGFVRPYLGDVIVILLIYSFFRAFFNIGVMPALFMTISFALTIEALQFMNLVDRLGLRHSKLATTILGSSFSWADIACYYIGGVLILVWERYHRAG